MTIKEAAVVLECKPYTVYCLCKAGQLGHQRIGLGRGLIRITSADIEAYIASRRVEPSIPVERDRPGPANGTGLAVKDYFPEM